MSQQNGRRGPCKFFLNGSCRFGENCKFSHPSNSSAPGSSAGAISPGQPRAQSPRVQSPGINRNAPANGAPPGTCSFFWTTGACSREFECRFRHQRSSEQNASPDARLDVNDEQTPDFFSSAGLALNNGAVREERHSLNPSEAHNHIKPFLRDNYHFDSAAKVQGFVRILASVNDRNRSWTSDSAQGFLEMIVNGNGIVRIADVLRFEPVDFKLGTASGTLSFQKGYFPIFEYLASDLVLRSTIHKNINALYTIVETNYDTIHAVICKCIGGMVDNKTWRDPTPYLAASLQSKIDGVVLFKTMFTVFFQYFNRFKAAVRNHPDLVQLVNNLGSWFDQWVDDVSADPPRFQDTITCSPADVRRLTINQLREEIGRLKSIVQRESDSAERLRRPAERPRYTAAQRAQAMTMQLAQTYIPPGGRHDNDFLEVSKIRIAPTHNELQSPLQPYLPIVLPDAPHHLPLHSMERHLDIQFRLLREELISTIRASLSAIQNDLTIMWQRNRNAQKEPTVLEGILRKRGGAYRTTGRDSVFFHVYTNATFNPVKAERRDLTIGLTVDAPPGTARDSELKKRYDYWKHGKRLQSGSLVALLLVTNGSCQTYLGVVTSSGNDIAESSKASQDEVQVRISFFDAEVELKALRREKISANNSSFAVLVDNSVMFESIRPFLDRLQTVEPTEIPFARYISQCGSLQDTAIDPPRYATAPRFKFNLQCLAKPGHTIPDLNALQPASVATARRRLLESSQLDPSQADAIVDTLTREVSLIQGPPGTGKSFTGKEILRVLFASGVKPIVLIAYTNHALDHMLTSILDARITSSLVRLGSRSSDERIGDYTLDKLEKVAGTSSLDRSMNRQYAVMKKLEEAMSTVMDSIQIPHISLETIEQYLEIHYPEHVDAINSPPYWVQALMEMLWAEEEANGEWTEVRGKQKSKSEDKMVRTRYGFWKAGEDIRFISPPKPMLQLPKSKRGKQVKPQPQPQVDLSIDPAVAQFFASLGFDGTVPPIPISSRSVDDLVDDPYVWSMSLDERHRLAAIWEENIRELAYVSHLQHYERLRVEYKEACKEYNDVRDESRRRLLSGVDLIGCTTTGAAKLTSLLHNIAPRVLMVEEAGQVLEGHILTSLVSSVHHLICIGDPQQLRPTLATYALSMDSERGKAFFKFDRSLMERLADAGMAMSQINVQRRMRPDISHFIRKILYPTLADHEIVTSYPPVRGMQKDVYFLNHINKENGSEDSVSKYNMFEVEMIRDLVMYLLKQGTYSGAGDIAVLCAYLGQLTKVRAALRELKIDVSVDERDEEQLARQGLEEIPYEQVIVAKHIQLGTVDIFQGREAKVVIVSLVRNTGTFETGKASIGFLKSSNRINVALSRAKHGLYVLGNASNLRGNSTWSTIIDEMEARDQIGQSLPIVCHRHPDEKRNIAKPGEFSQFSPAGGCLLPCESQLGCGHKCPSLCHDFSDNHRTTKCNMPCPKAPCPRRHPCPRRCSEDCGTCEFPMYKVTLPCGHIPKTVSCHMLEKLADVKCQRLVVKRLPLCEHSASMPCHQDPITFICREICGGALSCCSKICKASCHACQEESVGHAITPVQARTRIDRNLHVTHPCERALYCQHLCGLPCSQEHDCNTTCSQHCRQRCLHHQCRKPCSEPCAPCMEPCMWSCAHHSCPVSCGSICSRLPCDEPCTAQLGCGHPCPSVCGEPCEKQKCVICIPADRKADIVDFIMQRRLDEIDQTSSDTSERLITLDCGHIFTVETLDGHCGMSEYYEADAMGCYIATKAPPINFQSPPTCPTCRGPITALRYGRVTKRATLDILEQNVASSMSQVLEKLSPQVVDLSTSLELLQESAKKLEPDIEDMPDIPLVTDPSIAGAPAEPLTHTLFSQQSMRTIHGLSPKEAKAWCNLIKDLFSLYQKVTKVAKTRGAHLKAYEAALSTLFRLEMDAIAGDPLRASSAPEPLAMQAVNQKIGQPPHKADTRFQIEAIFLSLELRFMLAQIGCSRVESLFESASNEPNVMQHRNRWRSFVRFIYASCVADSRKALLMASKSSATRQSARASIYILRAEFEQFRFDITAERTDLFRSAELTDANRLALAQKVKAKRAEARKSLDKISQDYLRQMPSKTATELMAEHQWFNLNCRQRVSRWDEECQELEKHMLSDKGYQPLSLQEREDIVKAFNFSHRGHFYNCQNGHPFVITECGGAMEAARCPECGAPIGGGNHTLHTSNTRATEFEEIASRQGAAGSPWAWARGA